MSESLKALFFAGRHADVISTALIDPGAKLGREETPYVVASLGSLGQTGDAELLLRHHKELMEDSELLFAHTHLAISSATAGRYASARRHLGFAAALRNSTTDPEALFLLYPGLAPYRYATGRLGTALSSVHRAGVFLRRTNREYLQLLGNELNGHLKAATAEAAAAIAHLVTAADLARLLGRTEHARQIETARALYSARYTQSPKEAVHALRLTLGDLAVGDVFARISIHLEMCRQNILRRKIDQARIALDGAIQGLVGTGSRRYEAVANLRLIDVALATGSFAEAALLVETAERSLAPEGDDLIAFELAERRVTALSALPPSGDGRLAEALREAKRRHQFLSRRTGFHPPATPRPRPRPKDPGLNHRQVQLLSSLSGAEFVDVQIYKKKFDVSEITACRDLASLARSGHLKRLGKARATRYLKG